MATLTIIAPGECVKADIEKHGVVGDVMVVSGAIPDWPGDIKYAVCWWDKALDVLMQLRAIRGRNTGGVVTYTRPLWEQLHVNNSGLLALSLANKMKEYDEVRVLGMPVDRSGHYYDLVSDGNDLDNRFFFGVDEWKTVLPTWKKFKVASGNLLEYFEQLK